MNKYKGKNIRVSNETHKLAANHCGKKLVLGAWVDEAILEKLQREGIPTLERQDFTVQKETKVIKYKK